MTKHEVKRQRVKLIIFGYGAELGDAAYFDPLLHKRYDNPQQLDLDLKPIGVRYERRASKIVVDTETGLTVTSHRIFNARNERIGTFELVRATDAQYKRLCKSAGHFDKQQPGILDIFNDVVESHKRRISAKTK